MNKDNNKPNRLPYAPPPMYVSIDEEQCQQDDIPMHYWKIIYEGIRELRRNTGLIIWNRSYLINWLNKEQIKPDIRNAQIERISQLDEVLREFYEKRDILEKIEEELFYFLPHKGE